MKRTAESERQGLWVALQGLGAPTATTSLYQFPETKAELAARERRELRGRKGEDATGLVQSATGACLQPRRQSQVGSRTLSVMPGWKRSPGPRDHALIFFKPAEVIIAARERGLRVVEAGFKSQDAN